MNSETTAESSVDHYYFDREYSLQEVAEALRYSESGRVRGKIVLKI